MLGESVRHHVQEEKSKIFAIARELMDQDELEDFGRKVGEGQATIDVALFAPMDSEQ